MYQFKSLNSQTIDITKTNVFIQVEDLIFNTRQTIFDAIKSISNDSTNKAEFDKINKKTLDQVKDLNFRDVNRNLSSKDIYSICDRASFLATLQFNKAFVDALKELSSYYTFTLVATGNQPYLEYIAKFLSEQISDTDWMVLQMSPDETIKNINMMECIHIGTVVQRLEESDAKLKILCKNGIETIFNNSFGYSRNVEDTYDVNDKEEILQILQFIKIMDEGGENFFDDMITEGFETE